MNMKDWKFPGLWIDSDDDMTILDDFGNLVLMNRTHFTSALYWFLSMDHDL